MEGFGSRHAAESFPGATVETVHVEGKRGRWHVALRLTPPSGAGGGDDGGWGAPNPSELVASPPTVREGHVGTSATQIIFGSTRGPLY